MIEPDRTAPQPQPFNRTGVGELLSTARISWGLTVEEVAHHLNLCVDTIHALEQDDYSQLPGYTFVKGYVRSYAKLLKLDEEAAAEKEIERGFSKNLVRSGCGCRVDTIRRRSIIKNGFAGDCRYAEVAAIRAVRTGWE